MIDIIYKRSGERFELTMTGHAGSGEVGHDIVCAAASMLAFTLAANLSSLWADGDIEVDRLTLELGNADICCTGKKAATSFATIRMGFLLLAEQYRDNVKYTETEG